MSHEVPPLPWLRTFEAAARRASFTAAARELHMTQPAVSYQVRALERRLGARLFERHARRVELTELGRAYLPAVRRAFATLSASTAGLFGAGGAREVTVRCAASFATLWLAPRLRRFTDANPEVAVRLTTAKWSEQGEAPAADVDVRYGDGAWSGHEVTLLRRERCVPVCSPALAEALGRPPAPADCAGLPRVHILGYETFWSEWFRAAGLAETPARAALTVDSSMAALEVAASGYGLALVFESFAAGYLAAGRVTAPVPHGFVTDQGHYVLLPDAAGPPTPDAVLFRDWLVEELAGAPA